MLDQTQPATPGVALDFFLLEEARAMLGEEARPKEILLTAVRLQEIRVKRRAVEDAKREEDRLRREEIAAGVRPPLGFSDLEFNVGNKRRKRIPKPESVRRQERRDRQKKAEARLVDHLETRRQEGPR